MGYVPLEQIAQAKIQGGERVVKDRSTLTVERVKKTGTWMYFVDTYGSGLLRLSQGYDRGWLGIAVSGKDGFYLTHVKVDGWANGWMVPKGVDHVLIFYWPQLLQYVGFILLFATFAKIALMRK